jgi:hypothetical protein
MANWTRTLDLTDFWENPESPQYAAKLICERLRVLPPHGRDDIDGKREDLTFEFECLAGDPDCTYDDFDHLMNDLYDWGDTPLDTHWNGRKVCWIKTRF